MFAYDAQVRKACESIKVGEWGTKILGLKICWKNFFLVPTSSYCNEITGEKYRADGFAIVLKKLGFLSEAPDKLRWLDYSGKSTLYIHTNTRLASFSIS
jgi:hypothetical protein